ncbi:MAG TPA: glycosyltransferase [Acidimicrobiales bacterium]|nr:glycosyltransferase [Acidimicrobiales bacterium]
MATILRPGGATAAHTHLSELPRYMVATGAGAVSVVTAFSWGGALQLPVYGAQRAVARFFPATGVAWYRSSHQQFLRQALRRRLTGGAPAVIYALGPEAAGAALAARKGDHQRVIMAVHYRASQAEGWADNGLIKPGGRQYRAFRASEHSLVPDLDGIVYVSHFARQSLLSWLPEAERVPSVVVPNLVSPVALAPSNPVADFVTVGQLLPSARHDAILHALAGASALGHSFTWHVLGDGPRRPALQELARALGVARQVRFWGDVPVVEGQLAEYRAYLHACATEPGSLSILRALAAGLPVLAPPGGANGEFFDDGAEGRYWSPDGDDGVAALVSFHEEVLATPELATRARARFERDFSPTVLCPKLVSFLMDGRA